MVDAWLMYTGATKDKLHPEPELDQQELYCALSEEIKDRFRPTQSCGGVNCAQNNIQKHKWS